MRSKEIKASVGAGVVGKSSYNLQATLNELDRAALERRLFIKEQPLVGISCTAGKPDEKTGLIPLINMRTDSIYGQLGISDEPNNPGTIKDENIYNFEFQRGKNGNPEIKISGQRYVFVDENKYPTLKSYLMHQLGD